MAILGLENYLNLLLALIMEKTQKVQEKADQVRSLVDWVREFVSWLKGLFGK